VNHKDITIGDTQFRIGRFTAINGSFIVAQLLPKLVTCITENGLYIPAVFSILPTIPKETLAEIQGYCLAVSERYSKEHNPIPLWMNGRIVDKELEHDTMTVFALTVQVIVFNLSDFFSDGGLQKLLGSLGLSQSA